MGASARGMEVNCGPKKRLPRWPRPCVRTGVRGWSTGPPSDSPVGYALSATVPKHLSLSLSEIDPAYLPAPAVCAPPLVCERGSGSTRRFHPLAGGVAMQSEDENPQLRIVIPAAACPENPLASPLPMAPPGSTSKMPTSTTKGLGSFSLNRAKRGELTALDPLNPPKKSRSPDGFAAPWAAGASDGAPSPATGPALARTHLQNGQ